MPYRQTLLALAASLAALANADVLIDVRSAEEYAAGHLLPAILLPVQNIAEQINTIVPDKNETIYLYCRSGARAENARQQLQQQGYTHIINLGGFAAAKQWLAGNAAIAAALRRIEQSNEK